MASHMLYNAYVKVNNVDLSDHVKSVTLNYGANQLDDAAMSDETEINLAGIKNWSASVTFDQDYAAAKVDATLFPLVGAAAFPFAIRPDAGAISATNPEFVANATLASYPPVTGTHGDKHRVTAEFNCAATLVRDITP